MANVTAGMAKAYYMAAHASKTLKDEVERIEEQIKELESKIRTLNGHKKVLDNFKEAIAHDEGILIRQAHRRRWWKTETKIHFKNQKTWTYAEYPEWEKDTILAYLTFDVGNTNYPWQKYSICLKNKTALKVWKWEVELVAKTEEQGIIRDTVKCKTSQDARRFVELALLASKSIMQQTEWFQVCPDIYAGSDYIIAEKSDTLLDLIDLPHIVRH